MVQPSESWTGSAEPAEILASSLLQAQRGVGPVSPPTPRTTGSIDLTGYWESIVTEDWRWRMVTPKKGDYGSVTSNDKARKVADAWDPAADEAAGIQCKAYGAAAVMRLPGRIRITWASDTTLKIEIEGGTQIRLLHFGAPAPPTGEPTWQGTRLPSGSFRRSFPLPAPVAEGQARSARR